MLESEPLDNDDNLRNQFRFQLILGIIAIPLLIVSAISSVFYVSYIGWSDYWDVGYFFFLIYYPTWLTGSVLALVGSIAIIKRNGSNFAWILVAVYASGWVWQIVYIHVIFPWFASLEGIDLGFVLSVILNTYTYSSIVASLYAWWSIHDSVAYRPIYFSYLTIFSLQGLISYLISGALFGFSGHSVYGPEEMLVYRIPSLVPTLLLHVILLLFFVSQLKDSRKIRLIEEDMIGVR